MKRPEQALTQRQVGVCQWSCLSVVLKQTSAFAIVPMGSTALAVVFAFVAWGECVNAQ